MSFIFAASSSRANTPKLYPGAEECIKAMHLSDTVRPIVRGCISRYSKPDTFCALLNWCVFHITNACNKLLGKKSEWEIAKNNIQLHSFRTVIERGFTPKGISPILRKKIDNTVFTLFEAKVNALLELCLYAQNMRSSSSPEITSSLLENDLNVYIDKVIGPKVRSLCFPGPLLKNFNR